VHFVCGINVCGINGLTLLGFLIHTSQSNFQILARTKCVGMHVIFLKLKHYCRMTKLFCFYYAMLSKNEWPSRFDIIKN